MTDTIPIRKGEDLQVETLKKFLHTEFGDLPDAPLEIKQFSAGHSNLTYELTIGDWVAVLRRPPLGPVAPKAHDMQREFHILQELHPHYPIAPKPLLFSPDETIVGSPFFIMERKNGVVIDTSFPKGVSITPELTRGISKEMVDSLVQLHSIDYKQTKLTEITNPEGFLERQVHGWIKRYDRAKTDDIPEVDVLTKWLVSHIPRSQQSTPIHYDFKLNNSMFAKDELTKMVGLFDWEMSTVGDPLLDLGVAMSYWIQEDDPDILKIGLGGTSVTIQKGFMTREEFIRAYAEKSGLDVSNMNFYLTFAYFKLAGICQQIYYRWKKGQTKDPRFEYFNHFVNALIIHALHTSSKNDSY
ncbi:phosphotransferase family protein [Bacillus sp. SCS-151]|uniref:phosphotransferase family protein n=1 Tax=Nanhaiella sioensis TaxID=3115293 RepID=UPI00397BF27F